MKFARVLALGIALLVILIASAQADALYTITVSDYANVREQPRKDSADIGDLFAGDTVIGIGYQDGWVQVEASVEAGQGWVRADLVTLVDKPVGRYTNTSGGRVRIRKTPGGDHAHWLEARHSVNVIRWVDVNGTAWAVTDRGYVDGAWLEVVK